MKPGYWDRDGFHEGVMPAVDFTHTNISPPVAQIPDPSPQVDNSRQPVTGFPRGGCNSPAQASRHSFRVGTYQGAPVFACEDMSGEHDDGR